MTFLNIRRFRGSGRTHGGLAARAPLRAAALCLVAGLAAVTTVADAAAAGGAALLEWLTPPPARPLPQTAAEKERGKTQGRDLPRPELLQPTLDPALPLYAPPPAALHGAFRASASDVLPDLARRWIEAFERLNPGVRIELAPPYAGSLGAQELAAGKIDIAFVSRELRPSDITAFRAKFGYPPLSVPICGGTYRQYGFLDAVGVFVNRANPIDGLSFAQLDGIMSRTRFRGAAPITKWGQLGLSGAWADKPIHIYGVKPWNGFEEFVRQRVLSTPGHRGEWREGITFADTVFPIAAQVADDPDGIGYAGLAFVDSPVKLLPLRAAADAPYVAPTYENVALAEYPLSRLVYFNVNKPTGKPLPPALAEFLRFILSRQGQQQVLDQAIYLPLRARQVRASLQMIGP